MALNHHREDAQTSTRCLITSSLRESTKRNTLDDVTDYERAVERIDTLTRTLSNLNPWRCRYGRTDDVVNRTCEWLLKQIEDECEKLVLAATKDTK